MRNAIEYLSQEWAYKAAGIVSYGGISAGTRAWNSLKGDLATMKIVPLSEGVNFPMFTQFFNEKGEFAGNEISIKSTKVMLDELVRWTKGLKLIRENTL